VNHRRSLGGYHSLLAVGTFGVVLLDACAPVRASPPPTPPAVSSPAAPREGLKIVLL
jgi:hypothetical protein